MALTARHREVLLMLADSQSNKMTARRVGMSENTARNPIVAIFERLGRSGVLIGARRRGADVALEVWSTGTGIAAVEQTAAAIPDMLLTDDHFAGQRCGAQCQLS